LGLSISQQLVELQGGRIWVRSTLGQGSTISFTMPIASPQQIATQAQSDDSPLFDARKMVVFQTPDKILSANDIKLILHAQTESAAASALRGALQDEGYVVEPTPVNAGVLEIAELMLPDLIVLEAVDAEHLTIARRLIEAPPTAHIPVIVLADSEPVLRADRIAPVRFLNAESTDPAGIVQLIRECLKR
jgi:two-component system sensor histidine kinase ChiS